MEKKKLINKSIYNNENNIRNILLFVNKNKKKIIIWIFQYYIFKIRVLNNLALISIILYIFIIFIIYLF